MGKKKKLLVYWFIIFKIEEKHKQVVVEKREQVVVEKHGKPAQSYEDFK